MKKNIEVLHRALEQFNNPATRESYFALYDDNAVLQSYAEVEPGLASIKQFYQQLWLAFPDARVEVEEVFASGDKVACRFVMYATHQGDFNGLAATDKAIALPGITILRFANGKCVERWSQSDFLGLMQQLGAISAPDTHFAKL
ncbi:MAG: ester cyclase [Acidobacteriota bacterium]